jgi:hypothetical protein
VQQRLRKLKVLVHACITQQFSIYLCTYTTVVHTLAGVVCVTGYTCLKEEARRELTEGGVQQRLRRLKVCCTVMCSSTCVHSHAHIYVQQ